MYTDWVKSTRCTRTACIVVLLGHVLSKEKNWPIFTKDCGVSPLPSIRLCSSFWFHEVYPRNLWEFIKMANHSPDGFCDFLISLETSEHPVPPFQSAPHFLLQHFHNNCFELSTLAVFYFRWASLPSCLVNYPNVRLRWISIHIFWQSFIPFVCF